MSPVAESSSWIGPVALSNQLFAAETVLVVSLLSIATSSFVPSSSSKNLFVVSVKSSASAAITTPLESLSRLNVDPSTVVLVCEAMLIPVVLVALEVKLSISLVTEAFMLIPVVALLIVSVLELKLPVLVMLIPVVAVAMSLECRSTEPSTEPPSKA